MLNFRTCGSDMRRIHEQWTVNTPYYINLRYKFWTQHKHNIKPVHNPSSSNKIKPENVYPVHAILIYFPSMRRRTGWSYFEAMYFKMFTHLAYLEKNILLNYYYYLKMICTLSICFALHRKTTQPCLVIFLFLEKYGICVNGSPELGWDGLWYALHICS